MTINADYLQPGARIDANGKITVINSSAQKAEQNIARNRAAVGTKTTAAKTVSKEETSEEDKEAERKKKQEERKKQREEQKKKSEEYREKQKERREKLKAEMESGSTRKEAREKVKAEEKKQAQYDKLTHDAEELKELGYQGLTDNDVIYLRAIGREDIADEVMGDPLGLKTETGSLDTEKQEAIAEQLKASYNEDRGKSMSGLAYNVNKAAAGIVSTFAGAESGARTMAAHEINEAKDFDPDTSIAKQYFKDALTNKIFKTNTVEALSGMGWNSDKEKSGWRNFWSNVLANGGTLIDAVVELAEDSLGINAAKDAIVRRQLEDAAAEEGISAEEAAERIVGDVMGYNFIRDWKYLDAWEEFEAVERTKQSKAARISGDIVEATAAMTPTIVLSLLTGQIASAAGAAAETAGAIGEAIGLGFMAGSAGGDQAQNVWDETGDIDMANRVGLATAAIEAATEKMFGGIFGLGNGYLDNAMRKAMGTKGVVKYLSESLGEGAEEVIATFTEHYLDEGTWNTDIEKLTVRELLAAGGLGAAVSLLLGWPVAFSNGRLVVSNREEMSTEQTAQVEAAMEAATEDMRQEVIDRAMTENEVYAGLEETEEAMPDSAPAETVQAEVSGDVNAEPVQAARKVTAQAQKETAQAEPEETEDVMQAAQEATKAQEVPKATMQAAQEAIVPEAAKATTQAAQSAEYVKTAADKQMELEDADEAQYGSGAVEALEDYAGMAEEFGNSIIHRNVKEAGKYGVSDDSGKRTDGEGAGRKAGSLEGTAETGEGGNVSAQRSSDRESAIHDLRRIRTDDSQRVKRSLRQKAAQGIEKTSGQDNGLSGTSTEKTMQVWTDDMISEDKELSEVKKQYEDKGYRVHIFSGVIGNGKGGFARGAFSKGEIWLRADDPEYTVRQIGKHEELHGAAAKDKKLIGKLLKRLREEYSREELESICKRYDAAMALMDEGEEQAAMDMLEEMLCDMNAGMNEFSESHKETKDLRTMIQEEVRSQTEDKGKQGRAPPETRFSMISSAVDDAIANKGKLEDKYNQRIISDIPEDIAKMVSDASAGKIDIANKKFAIEGGSIYHEYERHSKQSTETSRNQIALTPETMKDALNAFYEPDYVEAVFTDKNNPTQRQSFAYAKKADGYYIVVEAVGGKTNPNVVPVMILNITEDKWNKMLAENKSMADILFENSERMRTAIVDNEENKKNRITAALTQATVSSGEAAISSAFSSVTSGERISQNETESQEGKAKLFIENTENTKFSMVTDEETLDFLENQKKKKVYRAMQLKDGKLYPEQQEDKYDYTKPFSEQVEDWKKGLIPKNDTLLIGGTPKVFQQIGFNALPMTINQKHIDYALNGTKNEDHAIGESILKQLPEALENPVAVIASETENGTSVVALLPFERNGNQIIAPVYIDGFGTQNGVSIDSNAVTSIYGRENAVRKLLVDAILAENDPNRIGVFYLDKQKATGLLAALRVTMPKPLQQANGFIHSIRDENSPVKPVINNITESQQFKRWFGDWQNHPEKASKVVNADGTPKVVYHGSAQNFSIFDRSMIGKYDNGTAGRWIVKEDGHPDFIPVKDEGFFFTTDSRLAERHAKGASNMDGTNEDGYVFEAYLNIRKPLEITVDEWYARKKYYDTQDWYDTNRAEIMDQFHAGNYDGIIIRNPVRTEDEMYVVLNSNQVKSATDNIGTFDPENNNIRFSDITESEEIIRQMDDSRREKGKSKGGKAEQHLNRVIREAADKASNYLSIPKRAEKTVLKPMLRSLAEGYLTEGFYDPRETQKAFDAAYEEGRMIVQSYGEAYDEVKEYLRTAHVKIAPSDAHSITDYEYRKKKLFHALNIVGENNPKGMYVNSLYPELSERWPNLFPAELEHPSEQLERMMDVAENLKDIEVSLDNYFGEQAEEFRLYAGADFLKTLDEMQVELDRIKTYISEHEKESAPVMSQKEVTAQYKVAKEARRKMQAVIARNMLTNEEKRYVRQLLDGFITEAEFTEKNLPGVNKSVVLNDYRARREYREAMLPIDEYNRAQREKINEKAREMLSTSDEWKDKRMGIAYARETQERNIRDIIKNKAVAEKVIKTYFAPVHEGTAKANRLKENLRHVIRDLKLSTKTAKGNAVSEAYAVQFLGEVESALDLLKDKKQGTEHNNGTYEQWQTAKEKFMEENPNLDYAKIEKGIQVFRDAYDKLFAMMNDARIRNGYEPVDYRRGYFPHFTKDEADSIFDRFAAAVGINGRVEALPTDIAGLTKTFKPGIRWSGHTMERTGNSTEYNALEGFDRYIEPIADIIYLTDSIQNLRALARQIRYKYSDEGRKKRVKDIEDNITLSREDRESQIDAILREDKGTLSNFVVNLDEYTNQLAGKRAARDRTLEDDIGRNIYNFCQAMENRVAANMVAVNPGSWLTNFIPITQGWSMLSTGSVLKGFYDTLKSYLKDDGFRYRSDFLTNRRGSEQLYYKRGIQKAAKAAGSPMEIIDIITAETLTRARYYDETRRGYTEEEALTDADAFVADLMADRSKGAQPTLFGARNPLVKLFTMFQLEVNNQLSSLFKDMPREARKRGKAKIAWMLLKYCIGAWMYNDLYELLVGRRPALDPLNILNEASGDLTGFEIPNLVGLSSEMIKERRLANLDDFMTGKTGLEDAGINLVENVGSQLPFVGGVVFEGGRLPISSAMVDVGGLWGAISQFINKEREDAEENDKSWRNTVNSIYKAAGGAMYYIAAPFGGGQLKKIAEAVTMAALHGQYTYDSEGNPKLQFPHEGIWSTIKAATFGKTSTKGGQEWVADDFTTLNVKSTAAYISLVADGSDPYKVYGCLRGMMKSSGDNAKREYLAGYKGLSDREKLSIYIDVLSKSENKAEMMEDMLSEGLSFRDASAAMGKWQELADNEDLTASEDTFVEMGLSTTAARNLAGDYAELIPLDGNDRVADAQKIQVIGEADYLSESEKVELVSGFFDSDSAKEKFYRLVDAGVSMEIYGEYRMNSYGIEGDKDANGKTISNSKKAKILPIIDALDINSAQKDAIYLLTWAESGLKNAPWHGGTLTVGSSASSGKSI